MMGAPNYSSADYLAALQALMPRGRVWPKEQDAVQTQALSGLTPVYARSNARASNLLVDAFPATTFELLPEWEQSLGLPDPNIGMAATLQGRRAQVVARLTSIGGQSIAYFFEFAASLGYSIVISQFTPFRMGNQAMGCQLGSQDWAFAWTVYFVYETFNFRLGNSCMGEPMQSINNNVLMDELNAVKPVHTVLSYVAALDNGHGSPFVLGTSSI